METLMSFAAEGADGGEEEGEEWVATHTSKGQSGLSVTAEHLDDTQTYHRHFVNEAIAYNRRHS